MPISLCSSLCQSSCCLYVYYGCMDVVSKVIGRYLHVPSYAVARCETVRRVFQDTNEVREAHFTTQLIFS